ncbi:MAG: hypothetical protein COT74_08385 [Bdellovibrionales bacterium CG10_big_fil_rev_8_21_14_0_10_45_34]|nr:MAG: hypothetical protein COT74_08385 [Bdellovibrionales bacterium CG10_big_fil_rev_8_21_14_0_10_45_34]
MTSTGFAVKWTWGRSALPRFRRNTKSLNLRECWIYLALLPCVLFLGVLPAQGDPSSPQEAEILSYGKNTGPRLFDTTNPNLKTNTPLAEAPLSDRPESEKSPNPTNLPANREPAQAQ